MLDFKLVQMKEAWGKVKQKTMLFGIFFSLLFGYLNTSILPVYAEMISRDSLDAIVKLIKMVFAIILTVVAVILVLSGASQLSLAKATDDPNSEHKAQLKIGASVAMIVLAIALYLFDFTGMLMTFLNQFSD